ncbi:hypothetical protein Ari01nite_04460 [Paractinoplanes rishiriensis]|uniref:L,D-TPase catalytic domain-containing protein n=1 Tax=Paractinoplanes rishiriensis TaxID=1050105 RepID=A0A919JXW8_9ACTN|nr:hypothetical protein Ari01nite_04460 [Actinoplanes rishiriensis]
MLVVALLLAAVGGAAVGGPAVGGPATAAVPPWFPTRLGHLGDSRQVVVVAGHSRTSTSSTAYAYQRGTDGRWRAAFPAMAARNGYGGWQWASRRVQGTGTTPIGTFTITEAFGLAADPGTRLDYRRVDGNDHWVGDRSDPRTYNMFQPSLSPRRTWRTSRAERLADYPRQYAYAAVVDFNRPAPGSVSWNTALGQYVTSAPAVAGRGSAIFLHVHGRGSTAGCVSLSRTQMVAVLRWLDPALRPRIVLAPIADLPRA